MEKLDFSHANVSQMLKRNLKCQSARQNDKARALTLMCKLKFVKRDPKCYSAKQKVTFGHIWSDFITNRVSAHRILLLDLYLLDFWNLVVRR